MEDPSGQKTPLYIQLADQLRGKIASGEWAEGRQIPTEEQLCRDFNVSRTTVRRSLDILVSERLIERRRPAGSFVRPIVERDHMLKTFNRGFTEEQVEQGKDPRTLDVRVVLTHASAEVAGHLRLLPGAKVIYIERLRGTRQKAFVYFETWLSYRDDIPLDRNLYFESLYALLRSKGIHMRKQFEEFEALLPDERIQDALDVKRDTAILKRVIAASSLDSSFHEYTVCHYIGSEYLYRIDYA